MIKKLRRRIILINMLLMGVVILGIFTAVNINIYSNSVRTLERGMNGLFEKNRDGDRPEDMQLPYGQSDDSAKEMLRFDKRGFDGEAPMQISSYVVVELDENGEIIGFTETNVTMDEEDIKACVKLATGRSGQVNEYNLMYVSREMMGKKTLIFTSNAGIFTELQGSLIISTLLFLGGMAVIFLISLFLSGLAVKPVKKAWEQQKQFVADASHELKTPLTVILANNNIMMSHKDSTVADERQWLESTEEEANHMKKLIDNMLFLAKSDAGTAKIQFSEVNLSEITEGCALIFEPVAFEKEIMTETDIEDGVTVKGDATQLNQLVHILVDNAVKYADSGTSVKIRLHRHGEHAELSVNNRGVPIPKEDIDHIFDRLYRAEKSRTTKGYGLGLSIAQRIVESMNGKIAVVSNEAEGTTFTVKI